MLTLQNDIIEIIIQNDDNYTPKSSDNKYTYDKEYFIDDGTYITSKHSVVVNISKDNTYSCILLASGGASGVHNHSALIYRNRCIVAVGPYMVALRIPTLDLEWYTAVDMATCFGVHHSAKYNCFISHGECEIAQVFYDGQLGWQSSGKDIFTNGFELFEDFIIAVDFYDERYRIEIASGNNTLLQD